MNFSMLWIAPAASAIAQSTTPAMITSTTAAR